MLGLHEKNINNLIDDLKINQIKMHKYGQNKINQTPNYHARPWRHQQRSIQKVQNQLDGFTKNLSKLVNRNSELPSGKVFLGKHHIISKGNLKHITKKSLKKAEKLHQVPRIEKYNHLLSNLKREPHYNARNNRMETSYHKYYELRGGSFHPVSASHILNIAQQVAPKFKSQSPQIQNNNEIHPNAVLVSHQSGLSGLRRDLNNMDAQSRNTVSRALSSQFKGSPSITNNNGSYVAPRNTYRNFGQRTTFGATPSVKPRTIHSQSPLARRSFNRPNQLTPGVSPMSALKKMKREQGRNR